MKLDEKEISIYEVLKDRKFETSLITTYNVYFPFYEDVILRRLVAGGASHNVLLMDKGQLAECLRTPSLRPRKAGYEYTLIPMDFGGAFHPKIALFGERRKGMLFVGSHNMTISGFGINRELTTRISISAKDKSGVADARKAYKGILKCLSSQADLPSQCLEALQSITQFAPWLKGGGNDEGQDLQFFMTEPDGKSLWEGIREALPEKIQRISLLSPFFDSKLTFLSSIASELQVEEIFVGIDPETVDISKQDQLSGKIRFVDASQIYKNAGYLHAKAYMLEDYSGGHWFISGSANASKPAWLAEPSRRNVEAVILHRSDLATAEAKKLGIMDISTFPEVSELQWTDISVRLQKQKESREKNVPQQITGTAIYEDGQIYFPARLIKSASSLTVKIYDVYDDILAEISTYEMLENKAVISVPDSVDPSRMRFVSLSTNDNQHFMFYIHHSGYIERKLVSSHHAQFRASLESLSSENPDIEKLITTVEKIIFENPPEIPQNLRKEKAITAGTSKADNDSEEPKEIESLAIHLEETAVQKKRIRLMRSGDLGHLLDVLIHHLGIGIEKSRVVAKDTTDHLGRSEEEQVGMDDDDREEQPIKIEPTQIIKICHSKVRSLVNKMLKQLEKAANNTESDPVLPVVQLVAVLALLRELRLLDNKADWIPSGATLFPEKDRETLLLGSVKFLFGVSFHLLENALRELIDEPKDEISRLHGLLLWLARDCGKDLRLKYVLGETPEQKRDRILSQYQLLCLAPATAEDDVAREEAKNSISETTKPVYKADSTDWFQKHIRWGTELSKFTEHFTKLKTAEREPRAGDLVYNHRLDEPFLMVALGPRGSTTRVVNLERKDFEGAFLSSSLSVLDLPESLRGLR